MFLLGQIRAANILSRVQPVARDAYPSQLARTFRGIRSISPATPLHTTLTGSDVSVMISVTCWMTSK